VASSRVLEYEIKLPPLLAGAIQETSSSLLDEINDVGMTAELVQDPNFIENIFPPLAHVLIGNNLECEHLRMIPAQSDHVNFRSHALPYHFDELVPPFLK
jgi:hypothetical protein